MLKVVPKVTSTDLPSPPSGKTGWPWIPEEQAVGLKGMASWPRISIVTPSYNQGRFLEEAIRSVLLQKYPNLEYIVMDGGSDDESGSILQKYDRFISYWQSKPDDGQADALRQGFELASGDILAWINADDFYEPVAFSQIAHFFTEHPDTVLTNGDINLVSEDGAFLRKIYAMRPSFFFAANLGQHGWPQQGCFWRRNAYETVGGINSDYQFCMDLDLFTRLVRYGKSRRFSGKPLANFRLHPSSKTANLQGTLRQEKASIITRYGRPFWTSKPGALEALWQIYRKQAAARIRWERLKNKS
jgi:glycosyltransferase involved in cell wall biosynthesis